MNVSEKGLISPYVYPGLMSTIVVDGENALSKYINGLICGKSYIEGKQIKYAFMTAVVKAICSLIDCDYDIIAGRNQKREYVTIRSFISYYVYKKGLGTYCEIAKALGNRDHSTIIHACETARNYIRHSYPDTIAWNRRIASAINRIVIKIELGEFEFDGAG